MYPLSGIPWCQLPLKHSIHLHVLHTCVFSCQMHVQCVCRGVAGATSERYGTARWNECVLSKPCRSKLIPAPDVSLSIELLCGGAMLTPDGVEVKAVRVCVCVCVCAWVMLLLPFPNVTKGPTPEEQAHNVGPDIMHVCVCVCHGNLPYSALQTHHSHWCVCVRGQERVLSCLCAQSVCV